MGEQTYKPNLKECYLCGVLFTRSSVRIPYHEHYICDACDYRQHK